MVESRQWSYNECSEYSRLLCTVLNWTVAAVKCGLFANDLLIISPGSFCCSPLCKQQLEYSSWFKWKICKDLCVLKGKVSHSFIRPFLCKFSFVLSGCEARKWAFPP